MTIATSVPCYARINASTIHYLLISVYCISAERTNGRFFSENKSKAIVVVTPALFAIFIHHSSYSQIPKIHRIIFTQAMVYTAYP